MNKKERNALCSTIAAWEWQQGGSVSEASAYGRCARNIIEAMNITPEDLAFHRAYEIFRMTKAEGEDDDYLDALCDLVEADYSALIDMIESVKLRDLRNEVMK